MKLLVSLKKKESVAAWNITYHEFVAVSNLLKQITHINDDNEELQIHHEYSKAATYKGENAVTKILHFFQSKQIDHFISGSQRLRNLVTGELVHSDITKDILNIFSNGIDLYTGFRNERFIEKEKPLSATIPRNNLPSLISVPCSTKQKTNKKNKSHNSANRIIALANERAYPIEKLLTYDLTVENPLFDNDGLFKKEQNKSLLIREFEKNVNIDAVEFIENDFQTCLVVDVMLVMRILSWKEAHTFQDIAKKFCKFIKDRTILQNITRIDFIFDSYFEQSIKSSERQRRRKSECIIFNTISELVPLPKQADKFWGASENKILLQKILRSYITKNPEVFSGQEIIFSTINEDLCMSLNSELLLEN